jgi:hypothetical protein
VVEAWPCLVDHDSGRAGALGRRRLDLGRGVLDVEALPLDPRIDQRRLHARPETSELERATPTGRLPRRVAGGLETRWTEHASSMPPPRPGFKWPAFGSGRALTEPLKPSRDGLAHLNFPGDLPRGGEPSPRIGPVLGEASRRVWGSHTVTRSAQDRGYQRPRSRTSLPPARRPARHPLR